MSSGLDQLDDPDARTYEFRDSQLLGRMFRYLLAYRKLFVGVAVLVAIGIALEITLPFVLRHAIDVDFVSGNLEALMITAILYVTLYFIQWLTNYGRPLQGYGSYGRGRIPS